MTPSLTERQSFVVARMYVDFNWSAVRIARVCGVGRRAVENAIKRLGNEMRPKTAGPASERLPDDAVRKWFTDAGRSDRAELQLYRRDVKVRTSTDGELITTYARRRCVCGRLNAFEVRCVGCGRRLDVARDPDPVERLIEEEQHR